jgi:tetratricopeptide (TPR) repeat protein
MFNPDIVAGTPGQVNPNPLVPYTLSGPLALSEVGKPPSRAAITLDEGRQALEGEQQGQPVGFPPEVLPPERMQPNLSQEAMARPLAPSSQPGVGSLETGQTTSSLLTQMRQYAATVKQSTAGPEQLEQEPAMQTPQEPSSVSVEAAARRPADELLALRPGLPEAQRQRMLTDAGRQQAAALVEERLRTPIRSLAGSRRTEVDRLLAQAEEQLHKGEYYRAAETYNGAITAAPDNALAWLGRSNALLAAGEYVQAYLALDRGISRFPEMLDFDLDLPALVGNPEILDVRRAELEKMLSTRPDYRIQFLLGYMEYFSGVRDVGLRTVQQAASAAPAGSIVREAYQILAHRGAAASRPAE